MKKSIKKKAEKYKSKLLSNKGIPISNCGSTMGTSYISKYRKCPDCDNTGMQLQTSGPNRGQIRVCPTCAGNYEMYINQYGTDESEHPELYIDLSDEDNPILEEITALDKKTSSILLPNGTDVDLITGKRYGKKYGKNIN